MAVLVFVASLFFAATAGAATLRVTTEEDVAGSACPDAGGRCSLRQALAAAAPGDRVELPRGTYRLTLGELVIGQSQLTLAGAEARRTVVDGGGASRVVEVAAGSAPALENLTLRNGNGAGPSAGRGGAVMINPGATLRLTDVTVTASTAGGAGLQGLGGGIYNGGTLVLDRVSVEGNSAAPGSLAFGEGGGIHNAGALSAANATVAANAVGGRVALARGGGLFTAAGATSVLTNLTFLGNRSTASFGAGGALFSEDGAVTQLRNAIVAYGTPDNCGGPVVSLGGNLASDATCRLGAQADNSGVDPRLGPLRDNGGATDTAMPAAGSPAIDGGVAEGCPATDQRGVSRPKGGGCDTGSLEEGIDVPRPRNGETVNLSLSRGDVRLLLPGASTFTRLDEPRQVPVGTVVDATRGTAGLTAEREEGGRLDQADFYDGMFKVEQARGSTGTTLTLRGGPQRDCDAATSATRRRARRLWGRGSGSFRTRGRYSAATVRGTTWLTEDRCDGTLTRVIAGSVAVEDFTLRKTVTVSAGGSYLARPVQCASRRALTIHFRIPRRARLGRAVVRIGKRRLPVRGRRAFVDLRGLPRGVFTVRVLLVLDGGRRVRDDRRYRTCNAR